MKNTKYFSSTVRASLFMLLASGMLFCNARAQDAAPLAEASPAPKKHVLSAPAETENANLNNDDPAHSQMSEDVPLPAESGTPEVEARREGLLQPEPALEQALTPSLTQGSEVGQTLLSKKKSMAATGPFEFGLGVSAMFDDNIFFSSSHKKADFVTSVTPGFGIQLGDYQDRLNSFFTASYAPTFFLFADHSDQDSVDQDVAMQAQYTVKRLTIGLDFHFQELSGADVEIGDRVRRQLYDTSLTAKYDLTDKTSFEADFYQQTSDYQSGFVSDKEYINRDWFNYLLSPSLTISAGVGLGFVDQEASPTQYYEQGLLRVIYNATAKVAITANAGIEFRQFDGGGAADRVNPVFGLGVVYKPFEETEITLEAYRRVQSSALIFGENYTSTGFDLSVVQRVTSRFQLLGQVGYTNYDYQEDGGKFGGFNRTDNYFFLKPEVAYEFTRWLKGDVFYEFRDKESDQRGVGFTANEVGIEALMTF